MIPSPFDLPWIHWVILDLVWPLMEWVFVLGWFLFMGFLLLGFLGMWNAR